MANILIQEDDYALAKDWSDALRIDGHRATIVDCASEALVYAAKERFDLMIVDIFVRRDAAYVPDGGIILISKLRQVHVGPVQSWWRHVPIIAVTGAASIPGGFDPLLTARDLGATDWMRKPIAIPELCAKVAELLGKRIGQPQSAMAESLEISRI